MSSGMLITVLALFTLGAVAVFALVNRKKTRELQNDPSHKKSTLAADAPDSRK